MPLSPHAALDQLVESLDPVLDAHAASGGGREEEVSRVRGHIYALRVVISEECGD